MPYIVLVADGWREYLDIFNNNFYTLDETGAMDCKHVIDLALAHTSVLD